MIVTTRTPPITPPAPPDLRASDLMTSDVATVSIPTTIGQAMRMMRSLRVRHLLVLGEGRFVGVVDDRLVALSLLAAGGFGDALERPVTSALSHYVPQVVPGASLQRVAYLLTTSTCEAVVVVDDQEHLLGIITMVDVVRAVSRVGDDLDVPGRAGLSTTGAAS